MITFWHKLYHVFFWGAWISIAWNSFPHILNTSFIPATIEQQGYFSAIVLVCGLTFAGITVAAGWTLVERRERAQKS